MSTTTGHSRRLADVPVRSACPPRAAAGRTAVFETYDIETLAPGYGCVLRGRKVVAHHYKMLDEILKGLDKSVAVSRYVFRDEER